MSTIRLTYRGFRPEEPPVILLPNSKSMAIRNMLLHALSGAEIVNQTTFESKDVQLMYEALQSAQLTKHVGDAGTPFRLLLAYYAFTHKRVILDGSSALRKRPMGSLLDSLRKLGAELHCLEQEGFAPIEVVKGINVLEGDVVLEVDTSKSSQFASALLLCLPLLKGNKTLIMKGRSNSKPYIMLTLKLMNAWGIESACLDQRIVVKHGSYKRPGKVYQEADWSAASYFYSAVATGKAGKVQLKGLQPHSLQGDAKATYFYERLGVHTQFNQEGALLSYKNTLQPNGIFDLEDYPDLAPSLVWIGAYLKLPLMFQGLNNLVYKESNRLEALNHNLSLIGATLKQTSNVFQLKFQNPDKPQEMFKSFNDHRMLMSLAVWAFKHPIVAENLECVEKSFPHFWKEWAKLNFETEIV